MLYVAKVFFTVTKPIPLAVWSGMYLYRELLNIFELHGVHFDHSARKPFYLSPILLSQSERSVERGRDMYINTGILEPGKVYWFRFSTTKVELIDLLRASITSTSNSLQIITIEESIIDSWNSLPLLLDGEGKREGLYLVIADLRFAPTLFRYRKRTRSKYLERDVPYPSPTRFILSLARDICEIWGVDLRREVKKIEAEVIPDRIITKKLYIGRGSDGINRYIKSFSGRAILIFEVPASLLSLLLNMLQLSEAVGVGKNRALGLGFVSVINVEVEEIDVAPLARFQ